MAAVENAIIEAERFAKMTTKLPKRLHNEEKAIWALFSLNVRFGLGPCRECPQCRRAPVNPGIVNWFVVNGCRIEMLRLEAENWVCK